MISATARTAAWLLAAALFCVPQGSVAKDKWDAPQKSQAEAKGAKDKSSDAKDASASAVSKAKLYRFKGEKKASVGGTQMMTLLVEDVFTGRSDTLPVPNTDPTSKEYAPVATVASVIGELDPGAVIEVETEKHKGRAMVSSVAKAQYKPGEETPNGFVFVESDTQTKGGVENVVVTLSKFGREVKVGVPMWRPKEGNDAKWQPDPKIDYVVRRLQSGMVVEAQVKKGRMPMLAEIYEYREPERGKFVGMKEVEFNSWPAAGFELAAQDGTTITFTLEGMEQTKNGKTMYVPNPQQLAAVRKLKKDAEIEVRYRLDGSTWKLRQITPLTGREKPLKSAKGDEAGKMKDDKADPEKPEMKDDGKPAEETDEAEKPKAGKPKAAKG